MSSDSGHSPKNSNTLSHRSLSSWSIRRPLSTLAITSVVIVLGVLFAGRLPVDLLPNVDYPHIRVVVNYPGVTPEIIEEQVTRPLERNLSATENLNEIHGRASEGRSYIEMYFDLDADIDQALQDASRQLDRARTELPDGIDPPRLMKMDPALDPIFELAITSDVRDEIELYEWVDQQLMPQLLSISGVGAIDFAGGKEREIEVVADPERLRSYDLSLNALSDILAERNIDEPVGNITSPEFDIMGRMETRYGSAEHVGNTMIPLEDDRTVRLSDIAQVRDGHREQRLFAFLNGEESIQISVMKQPEANTVAVIEDLKHQLSELESSGFITPDIDYEIVRDESFFINASIDSVATAAIIGGVLAMMIILLFLGSLRRSLIIASVLPVAIIATFVMMNVGGLTLNIMSLGGLALGVGLLIDNAIVMLENIFRHQDQLHKSPVQAAHDGSGEVVSAVVAGTMTNLAAVLPFLLITGLAALIFQELIFTIAFAIIASLATALTLVPALSSKLASGKPNAGLSGTWLIRKFNLGFDKIKAGYRNLLYRLISKRWGFILFALVLLVGSIFLIRDLGTEFLPPVDDGRITMRFVLPAGTSIDPTNEAAEMIQESIEEMPHVETVYMTVGGYFRGGQLSIRGGMIDMVVQLKPHAERPGYDAETWVSDYGDKVAELGLPFVQERIQGPRIEGLQTSLTEADIAVGIVGPDLDELESNARNVLSELESIDGIGSIQIGREGWAPQLLIDVDEDRASRYNLSSGTVANTLYNAVEGDVPTQYVEGGFEYNIRVRMPRELTGTTEGLNQIPISNETGQSVPLGSLVSFEETTGPAHIERFNQIRTVWVNTTVDLNQATIGEVGEQIRETVSAYDLPEGYSVVYSGEQEAIEESNESLTLAIALAIFFVFIVMILQYERIFSPLVIISSLPFALIGVALALWITGLPLSATVLLGIIFLTGIVVNNAILLVEFAENYQLKEDQSLVDAVVEAGTVRFRPILMTTLTTIFGMLPLAIGLGEGSELLQPLAITVIGGLAVGSFLTLMIIPGMYLLFADISRKITGTSIEQPD